MVREHHYRHVRLIGVAILALLPVAAGAVEPLVPFDVVGDGIPAPLTRQPGDARRGKAIAVNSDQGNCLICHVLPIPEAPVFGDLGPPLGGIGSRMSAAQLRLRIVDPKRINPATIMPGYYRIDGLTRVAGKYAGRPILSAQEIEDLIAYLRTVTAK